METVGRKQGGANERLRRVQALLQQSDREAQTACTIPRVRASRKRAEDLLRAQVELEVVRQAPSHDKEAVLALDRELCALSKSDGVRLKPSPWRFPPGLQKFAYRHGRESQAVVSSSCGEEVASPDAVNGDGGGGPGLERNLLILLHGFGDCKEPFTGLAETLHLPKTAVLALDGPEALPSELVDKPGFSWFTMLDEDTWDFIKPSRKEKRRLRSLDRCVARLWKAVEVLVSSCGWAANEIFFFGYGQGGTVALDMILQHASLGGAIAVASEVLPERLADPLGREPGNLEQAALLINGAADRQTSVEAAEASTRYLRKVLGDHAVKLRVFQDRGGEMLRGGHAEESRCLMEFLSDNLHGVGRKGSREAMERLGAEPVAFAEKLPPGTVHMPDCTDRCEEQATFLSEMD